MPNTVRNLGAGAIIVLDGEWKLRRTLTVIVRRYPVDFKLT
jgi:hypothetical protein